MEAFSEKMMEDAIVSNPEKYINEKGLKLLSRQYRIGSYIFDLLFEDRHGGKLIVELQKGTLDRIHTYKILDYYHEYKEQNPQDFIDVMLIANIIPPERKRRLNDLGIDYKEISVSEILEQFHENSEYELGLSLKVNQKITQEIRSDMKSKKSDLGPSFFMKETKRTLEKELGSDSNWKISGEKCIILKHRPTEKLIDSEFSPQIWVARPSKSGSVRCAFEISDNEEKKDQREKIAEEIRTTNNWPEEIKLSKGSTVVYLPVQLSRLNIADEDMNEIINKKEIDKIIWFTRVLDEKLLQWCEKARKV